MGNDPINKVRLLLDFVDVENRRSNSIADPWYTNRFDDTYRDIVKGCEALLGYLDKEGLIKELL